MKKNYSQWVHQFGIASCLGLAVIMMAFPVAASAVTGEWPDWTAITPVVISAIVWLSPYWISQTLGFMQTMGPGALYSTYVTGNATSLKLPAIMATQNICHVEPCSEAAHCVGVLAAGASAICVMIILTIGICFSGFVKLLVENPSFKPAFQYAVPAMFGALVASSIFSKKKIGFWVTPFAVTWFFCYCTKVPSYWYMLASILSSIVVGRIYYTVTKKKSA